MKRHLLAISIAFILLTTTVLAWSPENCRSCHGDNYEIWNASAHAESLKAESGLVIDIESCTECHLESGFKEKWGRGDIDEAIEPITCEVCHRPPEGGYDAHIAEPPTFRPEVNLSAEICGSCHKGERHPIIEEWNEYAKEGFDMQTMASHSEPTDIAEPYILDREISCVACKSTDGAILNLEEPEVYELNEEELPEPLDVEEWRITCVACHDPHSTNLWIEDGIELCSNCHNSEGAEPDGSTTIVHHPQWEMFHDSELATGEGHPTMLECSDCHMASIPFNETSKTGAVSGHTFNYNAELLSDPQSTNGCYECHKTSLQPIVEAKQEIISEKLEELEILKENASIALEEMNETPAYENNRINYNNALFYMSSVESDGSLGIHNTEKALEHLETSEELFNSVINAEEEIAGPGFESPFLIAGLIAAVYLIRRKYQ